MIRRESDCRCLIICIGNRLVPGDDTGARVHDRLAAGVLPRAVRLIDGGLAGLDLLRFVEGAKTVVFVDSLAGFRPPGEIVFLRRPEDTDAVAAQYGHQSGLGALLMALPVVCEGAVPRVFVVGAQSPVTDDGVAAMAELCLRLVGGTA